MKKTFITFFCLFIFSNIIFYIPAKAADSSVTPPADITGSYATSIDANSGLVLYDKNANEKAYPANLTQIMTAILLMDKLDPSESITVTPECVNDHNSNSQIFLKPGETMTRDTALFTMMTLPDDHDIACSIADNIAGSKTAFAQMMTEKAKELGATNTNFVNATGAPDPNQYTTAHDMALITQAAIKNVLIFEAMDTKEYTVNTSMEKHVTVYSNNPGDNPYSIALKTGYSDQAQNTLVDVEEKEGKRVITVILGSNNFATQDINFQDARSISEFALNSLGTVKVIDQTKWYKNMDVLGKQVTVIPSRSIYEVENFSNPIHYRINFIPDVKDESTLYKTGIKKGEKLGIIQVMLNGKVIDQINGIAPRHTGFEKPIKSDSLSSRYIIILPLIAFVAIAIFILVKHKLSVSDNKAENNNRVI